ncbi:MAG TPA: protein translocase subunit SecDF [Chitinophagaceae bacterium]|nr:protein translocase subunit SecDF [Chitinophagaceae bacterium]
MQLKGLVRFFAIALILICLYQLSFTWIVRSHESSLNDQAKNWVTTHYMAPEKKYPNDSSLREAYRDTLKEVQNQRLIRLEDSTNDVSIGPFGLTTYRHAKDNELQLGLDLQGGMSVTMEVGLDALIRSLANNTKDLAFNRALNNAVQQKATGGADLITLFGQEYKKIGGGVPLAPYFVAKANGKIKTTDSDDAVLAYLKDQSATAFENTYNILRKRIDRFGVSSATINKDESKSIITVELPGENDIERVRRNLQATANLQFFEVYNLSEIGDNLTAAQNALAAYLSGAKAATADTTGKGSPDSSATAKADTTHVNDTSKTAKATVDSARLRKYETVLFGDRNSLMQINPPQRSQTGAESYPSSIAYVLTKDTAQLSDYLKMDIVKSKFPGNLVFMYGTPESRQNKTPNLLALYAIKTLENGTAKLDGSHITRATQDYDEKGSVAIKMEMDAVGTNLWAEMTKANVNKPIAITLDNFVYSAPNVINEIPNGSSEITGSFSVEEAKDLANTLESGKLPAPARITATQTIGPTLGKATIQAGAYSFIIAFVVIFALMLIYYNTAGWVANIALILNLLFTIGILSSWGFKLTAPGIAGLVLTIGMAVDTNVIIFERIKEELSKGKGYLTAVSDGYKRSYAPVLDAHVTTFLTAAILFIFGLGPVLGFASTQMLGITLSLFCGILVSRLITDMYTSKQRHFEYFTTISSKIFKHSYFKFIEYRKVAYVISAVVLVLGIGAFIHGFDEGVEFKGGRSYTIEFYRKVNTDSVANSLKNVLGDYPVVKTVGTGNQLDITTAYLIDSTRSNTDSLVETALYNGLKQYSFIPESVAYKTFDTRYKQGSQTVEPSISSELKSGAIKAGAIAIIIICLYIFIRFRDWRYSIGTIVSLFHDVFVILAVFSFCRSIVPFPLEIDQYFIAAVLTVIGFSMNDTVIVYDRIREDVRLMKGESKEAIINRAINQTLSRTVMTSLTVFLTILILFIFGGAVTRGFAFAMLVGVITGTYSSIFVAAPILVDFAKNKPLGATTDQAARPSVKK